MPTTPAPSFYFDPAIYGNNFRTNLGGRGSNTQAATAAPGAAPAPAAAPAPVASTPNTATAPVPNGGMPPLGPAPDPVNVRTPDANWQGFNQFSDAVYNDATRRLDPQFQDAQRQFDQQMINQGLAPGSQAYNTAYDNFNRSKNDAYSSARNQGLGAALAAQQQFFGQNLSESQLANALARSQGDWSTALGVANTGANASMYNAGLGRETAMDQTALNRELGLGDLGIRADQLNLMGNQQDWSNLMGLLNFGFGQDQGNNGLIGQDFARGQGLMGLIPNINPAQIDAMGAYQTALGQGNQNAAYSQQQANATNSSLGSAAGLAAMMFMMCDREVKEPLGPTVNMIEAMKSLPVEMWRYKWEGTPHIGTYAQDWNKAMHLPERPYIDPRDMFGAILGAIKELIGVTDNLSARVECLESLPKYGGDRLTSVRAVASQSIRSEAR